MAISGVHVNGGIKQVFRALLLLLSILTALSLVVFLRYAQEFFMPVVFSLLIAYAMNPFVVFLQTCRIPRTMAAVLVTLAVFGGIGLTGYALRQQVTTVLDSVPDAIAKARARLETYRQGGSKSSTPISKIQQAANEIEKTAEAAAGAPQATPKVAIAQPAFRINDFIRTGSAGLLGFVSDAVLVFFLALFFLISGDRFKRKLVHLIGTELSEKKITVEILNEINAQIERFLLIQVLTSIVVACCVTFGLWILGLHQPAFWGVVAGVLCSIPYIGPGFVGIALMFAAFAQFDSMVIAAEVALIPLTVFSLEGLLVKPAVMGKAARINGLAMFLGLLFWGWIWGLIGIIVAVPIMMVIKTVCDRVEPLHAIGAMLDES